MVAESEDFEGESLSIDCPVLVTERLVLRPPHADDAAELAVLADNRRIAEMLGLMARRRRAPSSPGQPRSRRRTLFMR